MRPTEFSHGYAGDVAVSAGTVWVAWATCETDELSLFSEVNRVWPLRPGLDATTWREYPPATMAVYVSRLSPGVSRRSRSNSPPVGPTSKDLS